MRVRWRLDSGGQRTAVVVLDLDLDLDLPIQDLKRAVTAAAAAQI